MNLEGKSLLVLGGTSYMPYIREYADKKGITVYCAGGSKNEVMEKYADAFFMIGGLDQTPFVNLVKEKKIDGIVSLGNENLIKLAIDIAEDTGLPFYINNSIWNELQIKDQFKKHCREFGIPVTEEYSEFEIDNGSSIEYPLVTKPIDGSGSQGVSVCYSFEDLVAGIKRAKAISRSNNCIIERFIDAPEFIATYIIHDGIPTIWMIGDRYMNRNQNGYGGISNISVFPSVHAPKYLEEVHPKMVEMLKKYGLKNGTFFAQGFAEKGVLKFFDPALRFCGTLDIIPYTHIMGVNPLHWMINHALTGVMDDSGEIEHMDWRLRGKCVVQLSVHVKPGIIKSIKGIEAVSRIPDIINVVQLHNDGDVIDNPGTLQQVLMRAFIIKPDLKKAIETIKKVYSIVSVISSEDTEMVMPFSPHGLRVE